jgi:NCS2 family nucleobase:cation symporter-2
MAHTVRKPANLLYGVNDRPPLPVTFALGLQHVFILFISLIFPALIVNMLGDTLDPHTARSFVSLSMIAAGISTILQALRFKSFGSGYLCPALCGPSYFAASAAAATLGGLPLLFGMTAFAGAIEVALSRVMRKLRFMFPPEVMGLVVALVGIVIIPLAINNFFGISGADTVSTGTEVTVGVITLATMIGINVWTKGKMRLYSIIIGMVVGYVVSFILGIMPQTSIDKIGAAEWFSLPYINNMRWSFDISMAVPFVVATICSTFKTVGDLGTCQKINDADWRRADMQNVSSGILVDGLGGVIPGLIGAFGQSTSSSNVGLSLATGATSRVIAYVTGGIIIVLAFFPRLSALFIIMPAPVMGATLIFSISFMIIAGLQIIMTRMLDLRRTFVLGLGLIFGLSADLAPQLYASVHPWLKPIFSSSLALGSVTVIVMNLIMRIDISNRSRIYLYPGKQSSEDVFDFVEKQGGSWGARPEVIANAASALNEVLESVTALGLAEGSLQVDMKFDELSLDIDASWKGNQLLFTDRIPTPEELLENDEAIGMISSFLISRAADKLSTSSKGGISHVQLHFEH